MQNKLTIFFEDKLLKTIHPLTLKNILKSLIYGSFFSVCRCIFQYRDYQNTKTDSIYLFKEEKDISVSSGDFLSLFDGPQINLESFQTRGLSPIWEAVIPRASFEISCCLLSQRAYDNWQQKSISLTLNTIYAT